MKRIVILCFLLGLFLTSFSQIDTTLMSKNDQQYFSKCHISYDDTEVDNSSINFSRRYHPQTIVMKATLNYLRKSQKIIAINDTVGIIFEKSYLVYYYDIPTGYYLGCIDTKEKQADLMGFYGGELWTVYAERRINSKKVEKVTGLIVNNKFTKNEADKFYKYMTSL